MSSLLRKQNFSFGIQYFLQNSPPFIGVSLWAIHSKNLEIIVIFTNSFSHIPKKKYKKLSHGN